MRKDYNVNTKMSRCWVMNKTEINNLADFLFSKTFLDNIGLLASNPIDSIISLKVYPMNVPHQTLNNSITIGNVTSNKVNCRYIRDTTATLVAYRGHINPLYNSFLDYSPYTKIQVYLPYIGFIELDVDTVMDRDILIQYVVDFLTGKATAFIYVYIENEKFLLSSYDGQIAVDMQITGGANAEIARNLLTTAIGATASAIATNATGGATAPIFYGATVSAVNAMKYTPVKTGAHAPLNNFEAPQHVSIIYNRPKVEYPENFNELNGKPLNEKRFLKDLNGFTKISEIHLENLDNATLEEIREIKRLLMEGVILSGDTTNFEFTIDGEQYNAERGMTWGDWIVSPFNIGGWYLDNLRVVRNFENGKQLIMGVSFDSVISPVNYTTRYEVNTIPFYINGVPYSSPYNFTWIQWVNSAYNDSVNSWYIEDNQIRRSILFGYEFISGSPTSTLITPNDIINNVDYETTEILTEISFTIDSYPYITSQDTTWREWVNSPNNENSLYKIWNNKIYRMENNIIRVVEGIGGIEATPDDTIESFDYTTGTLSTLTFTLYNLDSTTSTYTATTNTAWNDWLSSPYSTLKFTRINNFVCVLDSSLQPHKVLKDINAEPQTITDIVEASTYSVDSNIYT